MNKKKKTRIQQRIKQRYLFFLERQFIKGAHYQLLFVAALIGLISIVGGLLVWPTGEPTSRLDESIWWAFLRLSDPGYLGDDEGIWRRFISTLITVAGYVLFMGSLVAIITSWLNRKIRNLEQGLTPVAAKNHVLILGWTNRTIHIAAEIFQSVSRLRRFLKLHGSRNLKLIILADNVTPDRLQELKDHRMIGKRAHEIILRSGDAIDREHLRRVDSTNASAIIIPSHSRELQELITPDVETIKALLSLNAEVENNVDGKMPFVVAEIQDESKLMAAYRAYSGPLEVVSSDTILSRLIAQNIRHSGLSEVYNELLSQNLKNNLYVREFPQLEGEPMAILKRSFSRGIVLGVVRKENEKFRPYLNLKDDFEFKAEDRLVLLARSAEDLVVDSDPEALDGQEKIAGSEGPLPIEEQTGITRVLILGWNHHIPALIHELGTYEDEAYHVTMASLRPVNEREQALELQSNTTSRVECEHVLIDYVREAEIKRINPANYDNIVLASSDKLVDEEEADARTIVGYILLQELIEESGKQPQVLLELSDPSNESLIRRFNSEVIIGPMILSHLLAQIALRRELHCIYDELFTVGGAEIIFRNIDEYELEQGETDFSKIEKQAARYRETAIGIYSKDPNSNARASLNLNPQRSRKLNLTANTSIVALTTVY